MKHRDPTHRLHQGRALCGEGEAAAHLTPFDDAVSCPTCRALIALAEERRRLLVRRSVILIGKLAFA